MSTDTWEIEMAGPTVNVELQPRGRTGERGGDPLVTRRVWAKDGTADMSTIPISKDSGDDLSKPNILTVVGGYLRVAANSTQSTYGNRRECHVLDSTAGYVDSEIRSIWRPPSVIDTTKMSPQMGHVHRATATGGVVIDQNIFGSFDDTWINCWGWDGATLTEGTQLASGTGTRLSLKVDSFHRTAGTPASVYCRVDTVDNVQVGDVVTVAGTGEAELDGDHTVKYVLPSSNGVYGNTGPCLIWEDAVNTSTKALTLVSGEVGIKGPATGLAPRSLYPMHVASRIVGTLAQAKKWRVGTPEPMWGTRGYAAGCAWELDLASASPALPASGKCGIITNHLRAYGLRTVADGVLNSSTTVTSATAVFTSDDVGAAIAGTGIPGGATIVTRNSATEVIISAAATATATGVSLSIGTTIGGYVEFGDFTVTKIA